MGSKSLKCMVLPRGIEPRTPSLPTDRVLFRRGSNELAEVGFLATFQSVVGDDLAMGVSLRLPEIRGISLPLASTVLP